jgi:putative nucleotidyltransferase with HDIG domain
MKAKKDSILLYISSSAVFKTTTDLHEEFTKFILQINEKDNYTFRHSRNVMKYSLKLYERLKTFCTDETDSNLAIAALFHDIGKIYTPDEVLKKKAVLELNEYKKIMRHPIDSARLLKSHFNERVVELAQSHHERLDGSGYPYGLTQEDIAFESRILAVADVFDAMTTDRGYNEVKTFKEAAQELIRLSDQFDRRVTKALALLVEEDALGLMISCKKKKQNRNR